MDQGETQIKKAGRTLPFLLSCRNYLAGAASAAGAMASALAFLAFFAFLAFLAFLAGAAGAAAASAAGAAAGAMASAATAEKVTAAKAAAIRADRSLLIFYSLLNWFKVEFNWHDLRVISSNDWWVTRLTDVVTIFSNINFPPFPRSQAIQIPIANAPADQTQGGRAGFGRHPAYLAVFAFPYD